MENIRMTEKYAQNPLFMECLEQARVIAAKKNPNATEQQIASLATWIYATGGLITVETWDDMEVKDAEGVVVQLRPESSTEEVKPDKTDEGRVYQVAYGIDTESLEDPDQLVLLDMTWDCADMDNDDLIDAIRDGSKILRETPLLPWDDLEESFRLAMSGEGIEEEVRNRIVMTVVDAFTNNFYK